MKSCGSAGGDAERDLSAVAASSEGAGAGAAARADCVFAMIVLDRPKRMYPLDPTANHILEESRYRGEVSSREASPPAL